MHIKRVELENIKSHAEAKFEFSPGSIAITGENGAGKTTILEAIAWTLFDVLDYKKDDFVRRGAKKGSARVTFESGLDERSYVVFRDTGTGYYVYDPELQVRIADKKEEVTRFLWQHLGVEPGTDLESLFKHAIGVPQGTFTAIFLATAAERKKTFDTLLKVEEYRRGAEELLKTQRYVENQIGTARETIARAEGEIGQAAAVEAEFATVTNEAGAFAEQVAKLTGEIATLTAAVTLLDEREALVAKLRAATESAKNESARAAATLEHRGAEVKQASDAAERLQAVTADAVRHTDVLGRIHELERERGERDRLRQEEHKIEAAEKAVRVEEKHTRARLVEIEAAHKELVEIRPKATEQDTLEKEAAALRAKLADARAAANHRASLEKKLEGLREVLRKNNQDVEAAKAKAADAARVAEFQARETELTGELARLRATLERDEQFQGEVRNGLCPILSEKCLNLKEGQTLQGFLTSQFAELRTSITAFETERVTVAANLKTAREAEKYAAQLSTLQARGEEITAEGKELRSELDALPAVSHEQTEMELARAEAELERLGDPKSRIRALEKDIAAEIGVREAITDIESNLERLENDRRIVVEQLESYKDFDLQWQEAAAVRDETAEAYKAFLAAKPLAETLGEKRSAFEAAEKELKAAEAAAAEAAKELEAAEKDYDRAGHESKGKELSALGVTLAETRVRHENAETRARQLAAEIERIKALRASLADEYKERERLEKVLEATVFIRDTLKEAAPLVARNYVYHVSAEANQLYREISGNAERTLKWGEDYGVVMEEGGYDRPFQSLSGGEQMAAALSVRLALLKQLSDIRIAFFDEPTTNMDAERRENLAMQIGQIKHFDQLFVISHDDTFEGYMDHELRVEK